MWRKKKWLKRNIFFTYSWHEAGAEHKTIQYFGTAGNITGTEQMLYLKHVLTAGNKEGSDWRTVHVYVKSIMYYVPTASHMEGKNGFRSEWWWIYRLLYMNLVW